MQQKKGNIQQNKSIKYIHSLTNNHPYIRKIDLKSSFHFCLVFELFFSLSKKGFGFRCCRCSVFFYVQREKSLKKKNTVHTRLKWNERKETLGKKWLRSSEDYIVLSTNSLIELEANARMKYWYQHLSVLTSKPNNSLNLNVVFFSPSYL